MTGARGMVRGGGGATSASGVSFEVSLFGNERATALEAADSPTFAVITVGTVVFGLTDFGRGGGSRVLPRLAALSVDSWPEVSGFIPRAVKGKDFAPGRFALGK